MEYKCDAKTSKQLVINVIRSQKDSLKCDIRPSKEKVREVTVYQKKIGNRRYDDLSKKKDYKCELKKSKE